MKYISQREKGRQNIQIQRQRRKKKVKDIIMFKHENNHTSKSTDTGKT